MTTAVMPGRRVRRFDVVGLRVYGRDDLPGSRARLDHRVSRTGFGSARWPLDEAIGLPNGRESQRGVLRGHIFWKSRRSPRAHRRCRATRST